MCLLFAILAVLGPRALVFFWWLLEPARWAATFESAVVPLIGFLFLPWTTSYGGSAWGNRDQSDTTWTNYDGV